MKCAAPTAEGVVCASAGYSLVHKAVRGSLLSDPRAADDSSAPSQLTWKDIFNAGLSGRTRRRCTRGRHIAASLRASYGHTAWRSLSRSPLDEHGMLNLVLIDRNTPVSSSFFTPAGIFTAYLGIRATTSLNVYVLRVWKEVSVAAVNESWSDDGLGFASPESSVLRRFINDRRHSH